MKKILALILALSLAAVALPMSISAAEAEAPAETVAVGPNRGDWTVTGDDYKADSNPGAPNQALYILGNAENGKVTLSATITVPGGEGAKADGTGFLLAIADVNQSDKDNTVQIYATNDSYYMVKAVGTTVGILRNDKTEATDWAASKSDVVTAESEVKLQVAYDNGSFVISVDGKTVLEYTDPNPLSGVGYGLATRKTGTVFKGVTPAAEKHILSAEDTDNVVKNKHELGVDLSSVTGDFEKYFANTQTTQGSGEGPTLLRPEVLFDSDTDSDSATRQNSSRFAADYNKKTAESTGKSPRGSIYWKLSDADKGQIANYLVIYAGGSTTRIADGVRISGSMDAETWVSLSFTNRTMKAQAHQVYGIQLNNDTPYLYYKIEFTRVYEQAIELLGLHLYSDVNNTTATPELYGYVQTKAGTTAGTKDLRVLVEASKDYLAKYDKATLTVTLENGETVVATLTREATEAYTSVIANGVTVTARTGYGFIGVVITGVKDVTGVKASVTFDTDSAITLGSANIA